MRRRVFVGLISGALVWPPAAQSQRTERLRRVGVLMAIEADAEGQERVAAFRRALRESGWIEGTNLQIVERWTAGSAALRRAFAEELVRLEPDVVLVNGLLPLKAFIEKSTAIPIVFVQVSDPVGSGFVPNLARPGGRITGFTHFEYSAAAKWLELLREIAPSTRRVAAMASPEDPAFAGFVNAMEAVAGAQSIRIIPTAVTEPRDIERNLAELARDPNGSVVVLPSPSTTVHRGHIIAGAARHRLPAVYPWRFFAAEGGLMAYGIDNHDLYRRAAVYIHRILRGENAGDLPVQAPTKFELVINAKAAQALGLAVPVALEARANEIIE